MILLFLLLLLWVFVIIFKLGKQIIKSNIFTKKVIQIITLEGKPLEALYILDNEIKGLNLKKNNLRMQSLLIYKMLALMWLGKWNDAKSEYDKLKNIKIHTAYYTNWFNYVSLLLMFLSGSIEEAKELYDNALEKLIISSRKRPAYLMYINILNAFHELYINNDLFLSKDLFEKINCNNSNSVLTKAYILYQLGIISLKTNHRNDAIKYLNAALIFGEHSYISEKASELLEDIDVSGAENDSNHYKEEAKKEFLNYKKAMKKSSENARKRRRIILISLFCIIAVSIFSVLKFDQDLYRIIPNVAYMNYKEAINKLEDSRIVYNEKEGYSDTVPEGKIIKLEPKSGKKIFKWIRSTSLY